MACLKRSLPRDEKDSSSQTSEHNWESRSQNEYLFDELGTATKDLFITSHILSTCAGCVQLLQTLKCEPFAFKNLTLYSILSDDSASPLIDTIFGYEHDLSQHLDDVSKTEELRQVAVSLGDMAHEEPVNPAC